VENTQELKLDVVLFDGESALTVIDELQSIGVQAELIESESPADLTVRVVGTPENIAAVQIWHNESRDVPEPEAAAV
jgi:hypothetical protein